MLPSGHQVATLPGTTREKDVQLIASYDRLRKELRWARGIVSLVAENEHTEEVIRESADCATRHLEETLEALGRNSESKVFSAGCCHSERYTDELRLAPLGAESP